MESETRTLLELISFFQSVALLMDKIVERIIKANPETKITRPDGLTSYDTGRIVNIAILELLPRAYGENQGYSKQYLKS